MGKLGFIGCGTMGKPMAFNLIKAGYQLVVYDCNPTAVEELVTAGAIPVNTAREVAEQSETIITMLPSSSNVEQAICGTNGVLDSTRAVSTIIDMSTINPIITREIAAAAASKGVNMIDAPVSGGLPKAVDGTLTIMVGGKKEIFEKCKSILQIMGGNVIYVGDIGIGEVVKLANQLLAAVSFLAVAESLLFGTSLGCDPRTLYEVITKSSGNCFGLEKSIPYPGIVATSAANRDFAPSFLLDLMYKDMGLITSAARELKMPLFTTSLAYQIYEAAKAKGLGKKDWTAVSLFIRELAGVDN